MKQSDYNISYIHPRDMDPSQPVIKSLSALRKFKSYCGLKTAEKKFKKMLGDFKFLDISSADKSIDWESSISKDIANISQTPVAHYPPPNTVDKQPQQHTVSIYYSPIK